MIYSPVSYCSISQFEKTFPDKISEQAKGSGEKFLDFNGLSPFHRSPYNCNAIGESRDSESFGLLQKDQ